MVLSNVSGFVAKVTGRGFYEAHGGPIMNGVSDTKAMLEVEDLRIDYDAFCAVRNVGFSLEQGDVFGLIGPNGAGKTSTLRALAGLTLPTQGTIRLAGLDWEKDPTAIKRLLGFMPDDAPIYEQLTVFEFLDHFARSYEVPNRAARIEECLEMAWLSDKRDDACGGLSRGMKQRLILARTLLPDPQVLLLDEPASGIDPRGRIKLRNLILGMRDAGKTIVVSSHILTEMSSFCNKVGIMEKGRMVQMGAVDALVKETGVQHLRLRWRDASDDGAVREKLQAHPDVHKLNLQKLQAEFQFRGEDGAVDSLLADLIKDGVRVCEWRILDDNLEQIFLNSGARAVS
jgi:ABC-2 type transport system ATP-binding protein